METARLLLRSWSPDDANALAGVLAASRTELTRWTPWVLEESDSVVTLAKKLERFAHHFETGVEWRYAMFRLADPAVPIGGCGLYPRVGPGALEIGYWLATSATGQGFATEAAAALGDEGLHLDGVERIEIRCDPDNDASMRVPRRLGYRARPGIVRETPGEGRPGGDVIIWDRFRER
jgi:RimJ/RimL family protein N-acetyltransferase